MSSRRQLPVISRQYGGKWVGWTLDGREILGSGNSLEEVREIAKRNGRTDIAFEWVPPSDRAFIGLGSV